MLVFSFLTKKKFVSKITIILSCVISYLLLTFIEFIKQITSLQDKIILDNTLSISFVAMMIAFVEAVILALIFNSKLLSNVMSRLLHRTPCDCMWQDVIDYKNGSNLHIYLKDKDYYFIGHFKFIEEDSDDPLLAISETKIIDIDTNEVIDELKSSEYTIVKLSDVDYIEVK